METFTRRTRFLGACWRNWCLFSSVKFRPSKYKGKNLIQSRLIVFYKLLETAPIILFHCISAYSALFPPLCYIIVFIFQAFDSLLQKLHKYVPLGSSVTDLYAGAGVIGLSLASARKCRKEMFIFCSNRFYVVISLTKPTCVLILIFSDQLDVLRLIKNLSSLLRRPLNAYQAPLIAALAGITLTLHLLVLQS